MGKPEKDASKEKTIKENAIEEGSSRVVKAAAKKVVKKAATGIGTFIAGKVIGKAAGAFTGGLADVMLNPKELAHGTMPKFSSPEEEQLFHQEMAEFRRQQLEKIQAEQDKKAARNQRGKSATPRLSAKPPAQVPMEHNRLTQEQIDAMRGRPTIHIPDWER